LAVLATLCAPAFEPQQGLFVPEGFVSSCSRSSILLDFSLMRHQTEVQFAPTEASQLEQAQLPYGLVCDSVTHGKT